MGYVVIAVCFGVAGGLVGKIKGSSFFLWFLIFLKLMPAVSISELKEEAGGHHA